MSYSVQDAQGGMSILAGFLGKNHNVRVVYHDGNAVDANIETGTIRIPKLACASGITEEAIQLLRSMVYHESGHIAETKLEKSLTPTGALFSILNALEDRRIEHILSDAHIGCKNIFQWATEFYNKRIAGQVADGKVKAPLWEALCAMGIQFEGVQPAWHLSPKAEAYVKAAYDEFIKVRDCQDTKDCLELAKKIYKLLDDACKEFNKDNKEEKKQQKKEKGEKGQKPEKGQKGEKGEPQSGGNQADDMPDEDEDEDEEGEESEGDKSKKSKKSDKKESKKSGKGDKDEEADEEDSDKKEESKGKGSKKDKDEDSEEDSEEDSDEENDEDSEEGEGEGEGKGKDEAKDLEEEAEDINKGKDKDSGEESDAKGSKGEGEGSESEGVDADEEAEDAEGESDSDKKAQEDAPYKPSDIEDGDSDKAKEQCKSEIEDECEGIGQREILNERLGELFDKLSPSDKEYLAYRDNDIHQIPSEGVNDKATFVERRNLIGAGVSAMTRALEQALRSMAKCRKDPYLRQGKIDKKRLVAITKSLSKEVFCKTRPGIDLDVAVEILVDESGSMGNFLDVQQVAIAIGEALSQIGIPFEIMGATTQFLGGYSIPSLNGLSRTNPIVYNHYKNFGENWVAIRHRIIHTGAHRHNVDGEFVEYAAYRLAVRKESRKVIFSLSDGEPCAGHDNDSLMCKNLKDVCNRIRKNGMEVYGFGIGTQAPESFYGKKHFVYLDKPDQMGQDFIRKFADVITNGKVSV